MPGNSDSFFSENARYVSQIGWSIHHWFILKYLGYSLLHIFNISSCHHKAYTARPESTLKLQM